MRQGVYQEGIHLVNANREEHVVAPQATVWVPGKDRVFQDGIHLINLDREEKLP